MECRCSAGSTPCNGLTAYSPIQLPALGLLQQLRLHGDSQLLRLINSKFLRIAVWRTNDQNELEALIKDGILKDISGFLPSKLGAYLFHFLLHTLFKYELPRRGTLVTKSCGASWASPVAMATALLCISGGSCCLQPPKINPKLALSLESRRRTASSS